MNITELIADCQRNRRVKVVAAEVIETLQLAAEATDPASRAELLDLAAVAEGELYTLAVQVYAPQAAPDFAATSRLLRYAALAERALVKEESGEAAVQAGLDGAPADEVALWEALAGLPDRLGRAALYRELAARPRYADREETRCLLEALALQEHHLDPSTPRHPDLVAIEAEDRRVRLSDRTLLATAVGALAVYTAHGPEPRLWLVFVAGMALAVALRLGAHERLIGGE